ncbi:MAG TPA: DUF6005 family protein [Ruminiclostridium sp.]|nr:DUF6005 family protein [Ruminiclostridium sp.]
MKTDRLFHGYNCYSAAVGEYCAGMEYAGVHDLILSQWSFFFDKNMLLNGQWYTGASDGPVDILLREDLKKFCSLHVEEHYPSNRDSRSEIEHLLKLNNQVIILVDFYYMESVRWEHLGRFGFERQHNPHFIILEGEGDQEKISFRDPYYNFRGQMDKELLRKAQSSLTRQGGVDYRYYSVRHFNDGVENFRELILYRFNRYISEGQFNLISVLGEELLSNAEVILEQKDFRWAVDGYFCLKSVIDQHRNLQDTALRKGINLPTGLTDLENKWMLVIKEIFNIFVSQKAFRADIVKLYDNLHFIAKHEALFAEKVLAGI